MPVAIRAITRIADADDVNVTPGAGVDEYALAWDNASGKFVLSSSINKINLVREHSIYCIGDSLTSGYGGVGTGGYQITLLSLLGGSPWITKDRGIGGNTTARMVSRFTRDVVTPGDAEYVCIMGGVNSVWADVSAVSIETDLQNMYNLAHNAGIKVVAITILPFKGFSSAWSAPRQAVLDAVNTWILNTATNVDYRVNAYDVLEDPGNPDTLLAAYDSGDGVHLSTAGYVVLGTAIYGGATWTKGTSAISLKATGTTILNQDVSYGASPAFTHAAFLTLRPTVDAVAGLQIITASSGLLIANIDSINKRVGINTIAPATELHVATDATTSPRGVMSSQHNTGVDGARLHMRKSRGSNASPTVITTGDLLGRLVASGYDGANYLEMGGIDIAAVGTIASTRVPTEMRFLTATNATPSVLTQRMVIDETGRVGIGTPSPGYTLDVNGSLNLASGAFFRSNTNKLIGQVGSAFQFGWMDYGEYFQAELNGALSIFVAGTPRLDITQAGYVGIGTIAQESLVHLKLGDATTNTVSPILIVQHDTSGTPLAGYGSSINLRLKSSSTVNLPAANLSVVWFDPTHGTRKADLVLSVFDTAEREGLRIRGNGSAPAIGFLGAAPVARKAHVADPAGGATVDAEARSAINAILDTLESFGLHATV